MSKRTRRTGEFCWINILTPQPAEARAFFGALLGWTYFEIAGIGHGVEVAGRKIGGLFDLEGPNTPKGTPAAIGVMAKVDSADETCKKVASLGGKTKPPFDVMDQGRMAVCFDPNGAQFDVWEPKKNHGTDVDTSLHGAPSWFETLTSDVDRASAFYTALFGWTPETTTPMPGVQYTTFKHGNEYVAGMMQLTPQMGSPKQRVDDSAECGHRPQGYKGDEQARDDGKEALDVGSVTDRHLPVACFEWRGPGWNHHPALPRPR